MLRRNRVRNTTELKSTCTEKTCELNDGNIIFVVADRFRCVEVLFQPKFTRKQASGVHDTSFRCFMKCDVDINKELCVSVVLSGGSTMLHVFSLPRRRK